MSVIEKVRDYSRRFFVANKLDIRIEDVTPKAFKVFQLTVVVGISEMTFHHHFEYTFMRIVLEDDFYNVMEIACKSWIRNYEDFKAYATTKATFDNLSQFAKQRLWRIFRGDGNFEGHERDLYKELLSSDLIEDITMLPLPSEAYWYRVALLRPHAWRLLHNLNTEKAKD